MGAMMLRARMKLSLVILSAALVVSFAQAMHAEGGASEGTPSLALRLYGYVKPLGIGTYASLWCTFLLGLLKFKFRVQRIDMRWHYGFAILTIVLATCHAAIILAMEYV
jgi:hypothetical protein